MVNVNISLFKISSDGKNLDFIVSCDENYYFTNLQLLVDYIAKGQWATKIFNLDSLFKDADDNFIKEQNSWTCRIPLTNLNGISELGIYSGEFIIANKQYEETDTNIESTKAITSNVNFVYQSLILHLPSLEDKCNKIDEELIRNYLLLWAHLEALKFDSTTAKYYYKILVNNFSYCNGSPKCGCDNKIQLKQDCGCKR